MRNPYENDFADFGPPDPEPDPMCAVCPYALHQDGTDKALADKSWAHADCAAQCFNCEQWFALPDLYTLSQTWKVCPECAKDNPAINQGRYRELLNDTLRGK